MNDVGARLNGDVVLRFTDLVVCKRARERYFAMNNNRMSFCCDCNHLFGTGALKTGSNQWFLSSKQYLNSGGLLLVLTLTLSVNAVRSLPFANPIVAIFGSY